MTTVTDSNEPESPARPPYDLAKLTFVWSIHAMALAAIVLWVLGAFTVSTATLGLAAVWFTLSSTSITAGYHRLFSHKTYKATWPVELFYLLGGSAAMQGSALQWAAQHRDHHTFTDQPKDPYNIKLGFWYAHMGWVVRRTSPDYGRVSDLDKSALLRFQHNLFVPVSMLTCFVLPFAIGALWHEGIAALMVAGFLRLTIQWHMTFCVNSVAHYWGSQKYSVKQSARGSWWFSFLVWGEMDHNFHHRFPNDFRTGVHWWDFDPAKWWIFLCSKVKLASNLRSTHAAKIQEAVGDVTTGQA